MSKRKPRATPLQKVERQTRALAARRTLPGNVSVRRVSPGVCSVHVNTSTLLLGDLRAFAGRVCRDRTTRLWGVEGGLAEHPHRDDAVWELLTKRLG